MVLEVAVPAFGLREDVLAEVHAGEPSQEELKRREFYAHLYLGLYFEALKDPAKTKEHIFKAEQLVPASDYMGDIAKLHAKLLRNAPNP